MTQYLLSMPHDSAEEPTMATMDPAELEAALAAAGAFLEELAASGTLVFAGGLHPPSTAVTVDHTGDDLALTDGPYTQAPEYLGGFWVVEAPDRAAAVSWAAKASRALGARIEVRAFQEVPAQRPAV
ncbi:YciI family protein [Geodermatophilus sp. SYSU D00698]